MTENLKRCPFCGNEAEIIGYDDGMYQCVCRNCESVQGGFYDFPEEAAYAWNSRPIENELVEKICKLEAENARLREALQMIATEKDNHGQWLSVEQAAQIAKDTLEEC